MAQKLDFNLPFNDLRQYVPKHLRNEVVSGLLDNLFNRFLTRDESVPLYGYVGRKPSAPEDRSPPISQPTVERDINSITPVLNFKVGTERFAFTVNDLLRKADRIGVQDEDISWLYAQGNNFRPPVDFDKFTNFFNYYWVAAALESTPDMPWNPEKKPEYVVIQQPQLTDLVKPNARASSSASDQYVLTGTGFHDQTFVISFTSQLDFTITPTASLQGPLGFYAPVTTTYSLAPLDPGQLDPVDHVETFEFYVRGPIGGGLPSDIKLLEFKITREPVFSSDPTALPPANHIGWTTYEPGDKLTIDTTFLLDAYSVTFSGSHGVKPRLGGVRSLSTYQSIDGVQLREGDRVLIQGPSSVSGIYVVSPQVWERAPDFDETTWAAGAEIYVTHGTVNGEKLWESIGSPFAWGWAPAGTVSNTSDWQEGNFWVSRAELSEMGLQLANVTQAVRPIIEFSSSVKLNSATALGLPADSDTAGSNYQQVKTEFNQYPLFDLFRYDGTHARLVTPLFYYVEDMTAEVDLALQKRVKRSSNDSADFLFDHGCVDNSGNLLFFKHGDELRTVWHPGYTEPTIVDVTFAGVGTGHLTGLTILNDATQQQIWTLTALTPTIFAVNGSKLRELPDSLSQVNVGDTYENTELTFVIQNTAPPGYTGSVLPFQPGDTFTIRIANLERPRYVYRNADGVITDLYGGAAGDTVNQLGAWQVPRTFIHNPYNEGRSEVTEGPVYSHFRSVLANQLPELPIDYAFGGEIKLWSEQHTLLAALLMQKDLTPISMINMAMRQYESGLNALRDIYVQSVVDYFSTNEVFSSNGQVDGTAGVERFLEYALELRALDQEVRTVLYDTTAGVIGFPATLPQLGISELVEPAFLFDPVLGQMVLVHHDGHYAAIEQDSQAFRDEVLGKFSSNLVLRSDGQETPAIGSFTYTAPPIPYKGELWAKPNGELWAYAVNFDTYAAPPATVVDHWWFNRASGILYKADGVGWLPQADHAVRWQQVLLATSLNELLYIVEQRLYAAINPNQRKYDFTQLEDNEFYQEQLKNELFTFAANNGLDPLGTNYNASDPFTWNYSLGNPALFAPLSTATIPPPPSPLPNWPAPNWSVPARWYNVLKAHQETVPGVIPTERPNLEPWKLFGFTTYEEWESSPLWDPGYIDVVSTSTFTREINTFTNGGMVRVVKTEPGITPLHGLPVVDGVALRNGDWLLLSAEAAPSNNGVWVVSAGSWSRAQVPLEVRTYFKVTEGATRRGTTWVVKSSSVAPAGPRSIEVLFSQVRFWTTDMWDALVAYHGGALQLSVNPYTDVLLPPYVTDPALAGYRLTGDLPTGIALPFEFGEGSPVEEVWSRSIEFGYAQAKALFRYDPLAFLGFCWGFNWVEVDGILYDGYDLNMPRHRYFKLHGDPVTTIPRPATTSTVLSTTAPGTWTMRYDAYDPNRRQNFSVRQADGTIVGFVAEGETTSFSGGGLTATGTPIVEDRGRPFRVGDTFRVTAVAAVDPADPPVVTVTFEPATYHQILGFGQTFTNALRYVSVDTQNSYAVAAYREWDVNMGHRAGGLVVTDDLKVFTEADTLSSASYDLFFKKNEGARDIWIQGLRVSVQQYGTRGVENGLPANWPAADGGDWVFRIEGYNPRYLQLPYYQLRTYQSGTSFPDQAFIGELFFRHDTGKAYTFNGVEWVETRDVDLQTFKALTGEVTDLTWFQPLTPLAVVTDTLPKTIIGLQNVVTFLFGYAQYCTDQGWSFSPKDADNVDVATGRYRDWQLEIEKLIDAVYRGLQLGQGHVANPFIDRVRVLQTTGLLGSFEDIPLFDVNSHAAVYDVLGDKVKQSTIQLVRGNRSSLINGLAPMFSIHALIDEYEHLFIFNNFVDASDGNGLLYDPWSGSRTVTYLFNGRRQNTGTFRPEFGGHYISNGEVRRNLQASVDSLARVYDANHVFENELTTQHALALLGFSKKKYFSDLDITDKSQFNFWRGLIQMKGTNASIDAYLNVDVFKDAKVDEYWAYKIAEYGDARQKQFPELKLQVVDCLQQFTQLQFDAQPGTELPNFTQISRYDEERWFSIEDLDQDTHFKAEVVGVYSKTVAAGEVITLPFIADELIIDYVPATQAALVLPNIINITGPGQVGVVKVNPNDDVLSFNTSGDVMLSSVATTVNTYVITAEAGTGTVTVFKPTGVSGVVTNSTLTLQHLASPTVQAQTFTLAFVNSTTFTVTGSASGALGTGLLGQPFTSPSVAFTLAGGLYPLVAQVVFSFVPMTDALAISFTNTAEIVKLNANTLLATGSGTLLVTGYGPAVPRYNPVKLFNYEVDELIEEVPLWHPAAGHHTPTALESVNVISPIDPARYSYSTLVVNNNSFDPLRAWGDREIGRTWVDTRRLSYVPYYDPLIFPSRGERLSRWGALADFSVVDVYEWVKSAVTPGDYNAQAGLDAGDADIDASVKASGEVALVETYARDRLWAIHPVAWSYSPVATDVDWGDRPPMKYSGDIRGGVSTGYSFTSGLSTDIPAPDAVTPGYRYYATDDGVGYESTGLAWQVILTSGVTFPLFTSPEGQPGMLFFKTDEGTLFESNGAAWIIVDGGTLTIRRRVIWLSSATWTGLGIAAGDRIGTWQHGTEPAPVAEGTINDDFFQLLLDDQTGLQLAPLPASVPAPIATVSGTVAVTAPEYTEQRLNGLVEFLHDPSLDVNAVPVTDADGLTIAWDIEYYLSVFDVDSGQQERIRAYVVRVVNTVQPPEPPLEADRRIAVVTGQQFAYAFPLSGLEVTVTITTAAAGAFEIYASSLVELITAALAGPRVDIKDAVTVEWLVPAVDGVYTNDPNEPLFALNAEIGWRAWAVPTQDQLDADGRYPVSSWRPYVGLPVPFTPTYDQLQEATTYLDDPLTLNNDTAVERYSPTWSEWVLIADVRQTQVVSTAVTSATFDATTFGQTTFDPLRTSVYTNGVAQVKAAYTIDGATLVVNNLRLGFTVNVIVRKYEPTAAELAFDPAVEEDYSFQRQFKKDYEYAFNQERDREGNLGAISYYFWVRNKSTQATDKKLSVQAITQQLRTGPPNFLTFQNLLPPTTIATVPPTSLPWRYDAITLSGFAYAVTKDDTFKLRFTRNFTLRDDPNDLDLKDVHTEWSLMRPAQKARVPERLWLKLVDSAAGLDAAGNPVPSLRRVLYDDRNNTATRFGFGPEQTLAPAWLLRTSLAYTVVNTKLTEDTPAGPVPDYIEFIDEELDLRSTDAFENPIEKAEAKAAKVIEVEATFFSTPELVRSTMTTAWGAASVAQVNELFFAALEDILASNYELTDIFKTSRLSLYSIQEKRASASVPSYE